MSKENQISPVRNIFKVCSSVHSVWRDIQRVLGVDYFLRQDNFTIRFLAHFTKVEMNPCSQELSVVGVFIIISIIVVYRLLYLLLFWT